MQIMNHVDFLDLVSIVVVPAQPTMSNRCPLLIECVPLDDSKMVTIDPKMMAAMNNQVTEHIRNLQLSIRDPNTKSYIQEYVGRLLAELYKNGYAVIEDIPEAKSDPYADLRKTAARKW